MREMLCILIIAVGICGTSEAGVVDCLRLPAPMQKACMDYTVRADYELIPAIKPEFAVNLKRSNLHLKLGKRRRDFERLAQR